MSKRDGLCKSGTLPSWLHTDFVGRHAQWESFRLGMDIFTAARSKEKGEYLRSGEYG
jgi:hypothetical protein